MSMIEATKENFKKEMSNGTALIDFFASWCGPCILMKPHIESLSKELKNIKFIKIDVDSQPELASQFNVSSIPTLLLMKEGKMKATLIGYNSKEDLKSWIKDNS